MMEERESATATAALASTRAACIGEHEIVLLLDGALSMRARDEAYAHLDTCETCRQLVAAAAHQDDREPREHRGSDDARGSAGVRPRSARDRPDADRPLLLPSGARLARYVILGVVGSGAMGVVYSAYDPELDRKVAIKLLRAHSTGADDQRERRVLREAQAMARLNHANVVAVYDVGIVGGQVFIVMEFVQGSTLTQWRIAEARSFRAVLDVLRRAGSGLAAAHAAGLVHRDFKPDNVLIDRAGRVLVADFGLARAAGKEPVAIDAGSLVASQLTRTGAIVGTPAYMAPEQLDGGEVDARSDVFSFCVTLHEALYGERPFSGATVNEIRDAVARGPASESKARAGVPGWVRPIVLAGLRAAPSDRPASMHAVLAALGRDPAVRLRRALAAVIVVLAAAAFAAAGAMSRRQRGMACQGTEHKLAGAWDARPAHAVPRRAPRRSPLAHRSAVRPDDALAESAAKAVYALSPLPACADADALLAPVPPPADPVTRGQVDAIRLELGQLRALKRLKRFQDGEQQTRGIVARAKQLGYAPLEAEALLLHADFVITATTTPPRSTSCTRRCGPQSAGGTARSQRLR